MFKDKSNKYIIEQKIPNSIKYCFYPLRKKFNIELLIFLYFGVKVVPSPPRHTVLGNLNKEFVW